MNLKLNKLKGVAPCVDVCEIFVVLVWLLLYARRHRSILGRGGWSHYTDTSEPVDGNGGWSHYTDTSEPVDGNGAQKDGHYPIRVRISDL
jgi:hypothetical protein